MPYPSGTQAASLIEKHYNQRPEEIIRSTLDYYRGTLSHGKKTAAHLGICYHTLLVLCRNMGIEFEEYRYVEEHSLPEPPHARRPFDRQPRATKS